MLEVLQPPEDEKELAEVGKQIVEAAFRLGGIKIEPQGLLFSWLSGTRIAVKRDDNDVITSIGFMAVGERWLPADHAASILLMLGDRDVMLQFLTTIANAMGAQHLYYEEPEPLEVAGKTTRYVVRKIKLQ